MSLEQSTIRAYEAARNLTGKPFRSACYAPYTSMYFNTNGDVIACCKNTTYVLGNVANERLDDIWRGKRSEAMRKAMRAYKLGVGCDFCEWQIKGGQYDQVYATLFDRHPVRSDSAEWPAQMEFTVSNTCNLACIMCYGVLSSTIRAHVEKLPPMPKVYGDEFFADLRKYLPHLRIAKFFGGEPFLAQENYRIWDMMIEDRIDVAVHITTNGTQWNKKVERILDAFTCHLSVSMDGATKETVEKVRVNARFEEVTANIEHFLAYTRRKPGATMSLTYCLMRQNWHEFGDYLKYAEARGLEVFINTVVDPAHCSLYTLPPAELLAIVKSMAELDARHGYGKLRINGGTWHSGLDALRKNADERQREGLTGVRESLAAKNPVAQAWKLIGENKLDDALRVARSVDEQDPSYYQLLCAAGHVLRRQGKLDESLAQLTAAIAFNRRGPAPFVERAWLHLDAHRGNEALADAEQAVRAVEGGRDEGMVASAYTVLARVHAELGNTDAAMRAADELVTRRPGEANTYVQRGWTLLKLQRASDAADSAQRALALDPGNAEAKQILGHAVKV